MPCAHEQFEASNAVNRIMQPDGSVRFNMDVRVKCVQCGADFRFIGLPHGLDMNGAACSVDGTEARLCIAPAGEVFTMCEGVTGFSARRSD